MIRTADCAPVLMMDKQHELWQPCILDVMAPRLNIVGKAIDMLKEHFGILPQDLSVWIGLHLCAALSGECGAL